MLRPVTIVLALSIFVGRVCPTQLSEGKNSSAIEVAKNASNVPDVKDTTPSLLHKEEKSDNTKSTEKLVEAKSGGKLNETKNAELLSGTKNATKLNETKSEEKLNEAKNAEKLGDMKNTGNSSNTKPVTVEQSSNGNGTVQSHEERKIEENKKNCNSTNEQTDMLNCNVTSYDDDADIERNDKRLNTETPTSTITTVDGSPGNNTKLNSPKDVQNSSEKDIKTVEPAVVPLNDKSHEVASSDTEHLPKANITGTDTKLDSNNTEVPVSSVAPLLTDNMRSKETESMNEAAKSTDENNKSMPSGIIALVTAISFAIAIVIAYSVMIIWRRYVEYRYGHRELLVNELEFDTNDLRHFEL